MTALLCIRNGHRNWAAREKREENISFCLATSSCEQRSLAEPNTSFQAALSVLLNS